MPPEAGGPAGAKAARPLWLGLALAAVVLVVDRLTKLHYVDLFVAQGAPWPVEVTPFFNLVMVWNRGISFGLLHQHEEWGRWILVAVALAVSAGLLVWMARAASRFVAAALGLVVGGAVGNVWDRLEWGAVADFFDAHAMGYHWPAFNVADVGINVGVALLVIDGLFAGGRGAER